MSTKNRPAAVPNPKCFLPVCMAAFVMLLMVGCASPVSKTPHQRFDFAEPHMGTLFRITVYAPDEDSAIKASRAAFQRVADLNQIMSDYDADSELMLLIQNPPGHPVKVSDDLFDILQRSQRLAERTDGAFDVTVGPFIRLWREARRKKVLPDERRIELARQSIGYKKLRLDAANQTVTLLAPNMFLDLGGIAKGYAADQALAVLKEHGLSRALVAASGDIAVGDPPPGLKGWAIGLAAIEGSDSALTRVILLKNAAVSTSGDTEQYIEINGVRYSHIVDPSTGVGLTERIGVSVIAKDAATTDSLATAVSVLGAKRGLALIDSLRGVEAVIVTLDNGKKRLIESRRFGQIPKPSQDEQETPGA